MLPRTPLLFKGVSHNQLFIFFVVSNCSSSMFVLKSATQNKCVSMLTMMYLSA